MIEMLQANWLTLAVLIAIVALFVLLRNRGTRVDSADAIWGQGEPVVVEVYSNT